MEISITPLYVYYKEKDQKGSDKRQLIGTCFRLVLKCHISEITDSDGI